MLSPRLKGKWSHRRRQGFHSTPSNYSSFIVTPHRSPIWYNLHSYIVCQRGRESNEGLIFHSKYPFLAIHAKGGQSISPKQKDRTTTPISNFSKQVFKCFSIGIFENSISIDKTLLNTKRRISLKWEFCLVKGKAFETAGENFKS
jgi:hypothetical protein